MANFNELILNKSTSPQEQRRINQRMFFKVLNQLGDMAKQDPDNVDITGGTIDGVDITNGTINQAEIDVTDRIVKTGETRTIFDGHSNILADFFRVEGTGVLEIVGESILDVIEGGVGISETTRITDADSPYTALRTDRVIFCDTDAGAITVNLHAGANGDYKKVINCGTSGNDVTLDPNGTEQIYKSGAGTAITLYDLEIADLHYETTEGWL